MVDEEDRENEGDLVIAAEFVTPEAINFMAKYGRGMVCLTLTQERCNSCILPLMTYRNGTRYGTAFTVTSKRPKASTGISAADRAPAIAHVRPASCSRATCSRSWRSRAACSCARATPRPVATSPRWRASRRPR